MNQKEFIEYYDNYNKKNNYELFDDDYIDVEIDEGYKWSKPENKVDFFLEFTKVFPKWINTYISVEHNIWFITDTCTFYCNKEFLDFCISKKLVWKKAMDLYDDNLEASTLANKGVLYEETYNLMKKIIWKK